MFSLTKLVRRLGLHQRVRQRRSGPTIRTNHRRQKELFLFSCLKLLVTQINKIIIWAEIITTENNGNLAPSSFSNVRPGDVLIVGGRSIRDDKDSLFKITRMNLDESQSETTIFSKANWAKSGGPDEGFHRHCSVQINNRVFVIGGSWTRRDVYELSSSRIEKLPITLPIDMYLHSCAIMSNRIWACGPGRGQGKTCISFGNSAISSRTENGSERTLPWTITFKTK